MAEKSHVAVAARQCPVCGVVFDVGVLPNTQLELVFEGERVVSGYQLCIDHKEMHEAGAIALVEIVDGGRVAHVPRQVAQRLVKISDEDLARPFVFVDAKVIELAQALYDSAKRL